jgi:endonuclease/exonuclease/phosphatase family metal-dependent hydrolase
VERLLGEETTHLSSCRLRAIVALLLAMVGLVVVAAGGAAQAATPRVKVMTRNMYIGADLTPLLSAATLPDFLRASAQIFENVQASDPPERIKAMAREIGDADPMIIGLQEVQLVEKDTEPPTNDGSATPANSTVFDFLEMLLDDLAAQGTPYTVVTSATNASAEVPSALGFDVKSTDRDVILAKAGLPSDELSWAQQTSASFATSLTLSTVAGPLTFTRGYNVADFAANKRSFRLVNTHLEAFSNQFRSAQAVELLNGVLSDATGKQVLLGDINSDPSELGTNPYDLLVSPSGAHFADSWTQADPSSAGLTCCFGELLRDTDASVFRSRIDVVLTRNESEAARRVRIYGTDPDNRTPSGLWPSDHAGVNATIAP